MMRIYVGNLPYDVKDADLQAAFSEFGEVVQVELIKDRFSNQSKGFGFVEMANNSEADKAIKALNNTQMKSRAIKVNQAETKKGRSPRRHRF